MFDSLRHFVEAAEKLGDVQRVHGATWESEVGCITELAAERDGPMLVFDGFRGYPDEFGVVSNIVNTRRRFALALDIPVDADPREQALRWRDMLLAGREIEPARVGSGPVFDNVVDTDVDLEMFPVPKWHERDGGRYIGTADVVITRDPDTGWVNCGTYRSCIQGRDLASVWMIDTKHGKGIARKYWARGEKCPVVIVLGCDPALFIASAAAGVPSGVSELAYAGGLRGAPVEVCEGPLTGLPIPAHAEIACEAEIPPPEVRSVPEGPFGEWPGYFAHSGYEPVAEVRRIYHRDAPLLAGAPPLLPAYSEVFGLSKYAAQLWRHLESAGITDVVAVDAIFNSLIAVIAIRQRYPGHAKQTLLAAAGLRASGSMYRYFVVVDDDIDTTNVKEVLWAMTTRVDPGHDIEIVRDSWTSGLDPMLSPRQREEGDLVMGRMLVDACRPFTWRDEFPVANVFDPETRRAVLRRWASTIDCFQG